MEALRVRIQSRARPTLGPQVDEVGAKYSAMGDDDRVASKNREAALLMVMAEAHLGEQGDHEGALKTATEALEAFRAVADRVGEADAMRLVVHAHRFNAELLQYDGGSGAENKAAEIYEAAMNKVKEAQKGFKDAANARGEGAMLLSFAEITDDRRTKVDPDELREVLRLASQAKALFQEAGDKKMEGIALILITITHYRKYERDEAYMATEAALANFRAVGDKRLEAKALHLLAFAHIVRNELEDGIRVAQDALAMFREQNARFLEAFECLIMAEYYLFFRKGRDALPLAEDALELYQEMEFCRGWQAQALEAMVQAYIFKGDERKALNIAREAVEAFQEKSDRRQQAIAQQGVVQAYMAMGDLDEALKAIEEEQSTIQDMGDPRWEAGVLLDVATVHLQRQAFDLAIDAAGESAEIYQGLKDRQGEAFAMNKLNEVNLARFDDNAVTQTSVEQRAIFQELEDKGRAASCQLNVAGMAAMEGRFDEGMSLAEEAQEWFQEAKDKEGEGRALNFMLQFYSDQGNYDAAVEKGKEMRECLREFGHKVYEANALRALCELHLKFEKPADAVRAAREGLALVKKAMDKREIVNYLLLVSRATVELIAKDTSSTAGKGIEKALRPAKEALTIAKSLSRGKNLFMGYALCSISEVQMLSVRVPEAMAAAREAVDIFRALGDRASEASAVVHIGEIHYATGSQEKALDAANEGLSLAKEAGDQRVEQRAAELADRIQGRPKLAFEHVGGVAAAAEAGAPAPSMNGAMPAASSVAAKPKGLDPEEVAHTVQEMAKAAIGLEDSVYLDSPLMDSGMDSLTAVSFRNGLQQNLGVKLPSSLMFDYPTMKEVANRIVELSLEDA